MCCIYFLFERNCLDFHNKIILCAIVITILQQSEISTDISISAFVPRKLRFHQPHPNPTTWVWLKHWSSSISHIRKHMNKIIMLITEGSLSFLHNPNIWFERPDTMISRQGQTPMDLLLENKKGAFKPTHSQPLHLFAPITF